MKLVTFIHQDQERIGAVDDAGRIVDLAARLRFVPARSRRHFSRRSIGAVVLGREMCEFLQGGEKVWTPRKRRWPMPTRNLTQPTVK